MIHHVYYYYYYTTSFLSVVLSCYSSSDPTHTRPVTLFNSTGDFTYRFLCMDAARDVKIAGLTHSESRDSERLCDVTRNR